MPQLRGNEPILGLNRIGPSDPFLSMQEPLTQSLASTLAKIIEIYREQDLLIPSFLRRNL
jgi:hypothetical protein